MKCVGQSITAGLTAGLLAMAIGCGDKEIDLTKTGLHGRIRETITRDPLPNVEVFIGDDKHGWLSAKTDVHGEFTIAGISPAAERMRINGKTASSADKKYPDVTVRVHESWIVPGEVGQLPVDKFLPRINMASAVDLGPLLEVSTDPEHPASDGWKHLPATAATVDIVGRDLIVFGDEQQGEKAPSEDIRRKSNVLARIRPDTFLKFPVEADPVITVTPVPLDQLPHQLPDYVSPLMMVTFQPGGTLVDPPAELHFGDFRGLNEIAPDMDFTVWSLSHSMALFLELGGAAFGKDDDERSEIATAAGVGLKELGWHGPVCTSESFSLKVEVRSDATEYAPPDGTVTLTVEGGSGGAAANTSASNVGDTIQTPAISTCGGYFTVTHAPVGGTRLSWGKSEWLCATEVGNNDLAGTVVFDLDQSPAQIFLTPLLPPC